MLIEKIEKLSNFLFKNITVIIVLLVLLYIFVGTKNTNSDTMQLQYAGNPDISYGGSPMLRASMNAGNYETNSKVVKGYGLSIEVDNTANIYSLVADKVAKANGFIDSFNSYNYIGNELAHSFVLRIPADKIINYIDYFKSLGVVKNESSNAIDLGEQYLDNENRLKNLYLRRDRLRKMMENKTEKLADVLAVDKELSNVQIEIEKLENLNKKIDTNVEYSKLELNVLPKVKISSLNNAEWQVSTSWKKAVNKFVLFSQQGIDYVFQFITLLPIIIGFAILVFAIRKIVYKINQN